MAVKPSQYHYKNVTISAMMLMVMVMVIQGHVVVGINTDTDTNTDTVIASSSWCVARSDASTQALQRALDYACYGSAADCAPIQPNGLCYLPNTIQAHASYAFNSYFQRKSMSPGSCDFSATATVAKSDPSYGSCVYPSSLSTAGGGIITTPSSTTPTVIGGNTLPLPPPPPTIFGVGGGIIAGGGVSPGTQTSPMDNTSSSTSSFGFAWVSTILIFILFFCIN